MRQRPGRKSRGGYPGSRRRHVRDQEQIVLFLDLANLARDHRRLGDLSGAATAIGSVVARLRKRGRILLAVACCDEGLAQELGSKLKRFGVMTITHSGSPEETDGWLIRRLRAVSSEATTVVIGSGDSSFAAEALRLSDEGKRIEVISRKGTVSAELYMRADEFHEFPFPRRPSGSSGP